MVKIVDVPGVGSFGLPDDLTPEQIQQFKENVQRNGGVLKAPPPPEVGQGGIPLVSPILSGASSSLAEIPISIYGLADKKGAQAARDVVMPFIQRAYLMDPTKQPTTTESVASGIGSIVPLIAATVASEGAATPLLSARLGLGGVRALTAAEEAAAAARLASGVQKARLVGGAAAAVPLGMSQAQQMAAAYEQRTGNELTPGQYAAANIAGGAIGLFDLAPMERWAEPIAKLLQKVPASEAITASKIVNNAKSRFLGKVAAGAAMEGGQEAVTQIAQNLAAAGIYDPEQSVTESVAANFGLGAGVGGIVEGALLAAAGVKGRRNLAKGKQFETDVRNKFVEASQGKDNLQFVETAQTVKNLPQQPIINQTPEEIAAEIQSANTDLTKAQADLAFFDKTGGATGGKVKSEKAVPIDTLSSSEINDLAARLRVKPKQGETVEQAIGSIENQNRVTRELIAQRVDVLQKRADNAQRKLDLLQSEGTSADKGLVVNRKFEVRNAPSATHTFSDVASAAINGTAVEDVRTPLEAIKALRPLVNRKNIAGPRPDVSNLTDQEIESVIKKAKVKLEPSETPRQAVESLSDNALKKALISRELDAVREIAGKQNMFAIVENQFDAQGNKIGEAVVRRHADQETADKGAKLLNEAANPEEYQARVAPYAKSLRNALSGMGLPDVGLRFEQFINGKDSYEEGAYDPRQRVIELVTGIYSPGMTEAQIEAKLTSVLNHEVIHALKDLGVFTKAEWNTLVRAAETRNMDGKLYTPAEWVAGIRSDLAKDATAGNARAAEVLQEEAVAEMFRNWVANGKKTAPASNLMSRILNFFKRLIGFNRKHEAEAIFADIASGKIGRRERTTTQQPVLALPAPAIPMGAPSPVEATTPTEAAPEATEPRLGATGTMYQPVTMEAPERPAEMQGPEDQYPVYESEMYQPVSGIRKMRPYRGEDARAAYEDVRLSSKVEIPKVAQARIGDDGKLVINPYPEGNIGTSTRYIREGETLVRKKGQKVGIEDIARAFDNITQQRDILDPAQRNEIIDSIVDEVNLQREQAVSGIGWYDSDVSSTFSILSEALPILKDPYAGAMHRRMFTIVAGVMSNGMKAKENVHLGGLNFAHFMNTGEFSTINPLTGKGYNQRTNIMSRQIDMLNKIYNDPMFAPRPGSNDPQMERMERFVEWMFTPHSVREINALRARGGIPSPAKIGGVDDQRLGMYAFGPKFGPFILNLNGLSDETVDSWASRSFYRHMGQAITNGKMNDGPRSPAEREAMKSALRDIADRTGLTSRDVQAVLWFYEKELYNKLGKNIPLEVFSDGARQFVREYNNAKQNVGTGQARGRTFAGTVGAARTRVRPGAQRAIAIEVRKPDKTISEIADKYIKKQSAVALPPNLEVAYERSFDAPVKRTFFEKVTDFFTGDTALRFIQGGFNQDQIIEFTEKAVHGERLSAAMSPIVSALMARRSSFVSAAAMFNGIAPVQYANKGDIMSAYIRAANPSENVDSIAKFMAPIEKKGLTKQFAIYGIARRAKSKPDMKIVNMDDAEINEAINLEKQYPELKEAFEAYQRHNKNLIQMAVDSGRIGQDEADAMLEDLNYYGAYRVYNNELTAPTPGGNLGGGTKIHKLSGESDEKILDDPIEIMVRNQNFWVNAAMKNLAALKVGNLAVTAGEANIVKGTPPAGAYTMVAYDKGKKVVYQFTSKRADLWYNSMRSNDRLDLGAVGQLLGFPSNVLRASVTHDPGFMIANLFRDALSTWGLRGENVMPWDTFGNAIEAYKGSASLDALQSYGVGGGYDVAMKDPETQAKLIKGELGKGVHSMADPMKLMGGLLRRVEKISEASDAATRLAVFKKVMEETGDEYEAAFRALEIMNFSKHGSNTIVQALSQIVPFFNAGLQGKLVLGKSLAAAYKGIKNGGFDTLSAEERRLGKGMLYRGTVMASVALALEMLCSGDDEYEDRVAPYMRETNFLIPLKYFGMPGTFIKIPKPFEMGAIFATVPVAFYRWGTNENDSSKDLIRTMTSQFSTNMGLNVTPQLIAPVVEHYFNIDLYSGQPLIGRGKQGLDPSLQYNSSTGEISKILGGFKIAYDFDKGEFVGIPPIIVQNYIQSWGGPLGSYLLLAADSVASGGDFTTVNASTPITKYPVIRRFLMEAKDQNPVGADNLYKMIGKLDEVNRTIAFYKKVGDSEALREYVAKNKPILDRASMIKRLSKAARNVRQMDTATLEDRKMTAQQKLEEQRRINDLEEKYLEDIRKLKRELNL